MHINDILYRPDLQAFTERFYAKVRKDTGPKGCWEWTARVAKGDYGCVMVTNEHGKRQSFSAHRVSYVLSKSPLPKGRQWNGRGGYDGVLIRHKCNNRKCVNPAHLKIGTALQNVRDRTKAGWGYGETVPTAKLKLEQVRAIRLDMRPQSIIAKEYGVLVCTISAIQTRRSWKCEPTPAPVRPWHSPGRKGQEAGRAKLTDADVLAIREDPGKHRDIAKRYGVTHTMIGFIKRRKAWTHLP